MYVIGTLLTVFPMLVTYHWANRSFPWLGRRPKWMACLLVGCLVANAVLRSLVVSGFGAVAGHPQIVAILVLTAIDLTSVPLAALGALTWSCARSRRARRPPAPSTVPPDGLTRRQLVEGTGGLALWGATGSLLGWGAIRGRHAFQLREFPVRIAGLPRALDGYVIAQVSDIHTGIYVGERELDEGLALVRAVRPDLVVVTGDLVDFDSTYAPLVARRLADLPSRDGVAAILGNHDYYTGAARVAAAMRAAGLRMLVNEGCVIRPGDGGGFALLGVDDLAASRYRGDGPLLDRALKDVPPEIPRVLLSHRPHTVDRWPGRAALQLSGHTHGGQINPAGLRFADLLFRYVA